jgi:hypothetical protein
MSTLRVTNVRDYSGTSGFTLSSGALTTTGRLIVNNLVVNGTISGSTAQFLPSQSGQATKNLGTNGSSTLWQQAASVGNITSMQVFTSGGTWTRPAGVRFIHVQVQGGGGGGSGHGESGGSGGYSERIIDVQSTSSVSVTVSGESNGTYYAGAGDNGGSSSFGSFCSAGGGYGANRNNQHSGGLAGVITLAAVIMDLDLIWAAVLLVDGLKVVTLVITTSHTPLLVLVAVVLTIITIEVLMVDQVWSS